MEPGIGKDKLLSLSVRTASPNEVTRNFSAPYCDSYLCDCDSYVTHCDWYFKDLFTFLRSSSKIPRRDLAMRLDDPDGIF